jgi:probable F420-dependent oxidoreductase
VTARMGITIPFDDVPLADQREWYAEAAELGYTDLWSAEVNGADGLTPLLVAATAAPAARLGTAIHPVYTRGPGLLAMSIASMAEAAPGRFVAGIGASSDVIVERWNATAFDRPYQRVRDTVRFLRKALAGDRVDEEFETFRVRGFRLARPLPPGAVPPLLVAALRPGMLRLAGREADGAILNWLSADDVRTVVPHVGEGKEVAARIFVVPTPDRDAARKIGRFMIGAYLTVPVYEAFHRWLGRGPLLDGMWAAWNAGDRKGAGAAIPDEVVDDLVVHGSAEECRAHVARYVANGVTTPVLAVVAPGGPDAARQAMRDLSPAASR